MNNIPVYTEEILTLTTSQMVEVDRLMIEDYHIELIQMMENAGRCLAILAKKRFLGDFAENKRVTVLAGPGGNGGGALVCARRLYAWGFNVEVYLMAREQMTPIPAHQLDILERMKVPVHNADSLKNVENTDLIIDGVIGYSVKGDPHGAAKEMIEWANETDVPTLSLDTPSGLDLTTGTIHTPTIQAEATLTLALPKQGLYEREAKKFRRELYLGDISVPPALYAEPSLGLDVDVIFKESDVIKIN